MGNKMTTHNKYKSFLFFIKNYRVAEPVPPQDLKEEFSKFTGAESYMSAEQLHRFLVEHQGEEDYTLFDSIKIVEKVLEERKTCQDIFDQNIEQQITLDELFRFLLHDESNGPLKAKVSSFHASLVTMEFLLLSVRVGCVYVYQNNC